MRLTLRIDSTEAQAFLQNLEPNINKAVRIGLIDFMDRVANRVKRKLSGEVLRVRSGRLRQSIHSTVEKMPWGWLGQVGTNVKYAGIHEYGGTIVLPVIYPVKKKALYFFIGGKEIFARRVRAHAIRMPERSFLRTALAEAEPFAAGIILGHVEEALHASN